MARVPKTRNAGTMTESAYWSKIRSVLRRGFMYWKPIQNVKNKAKRKSQSDNKRLKFEYQCAECKEWFPGKEVQVDHKIPVGSLKCGDDLKGFMERLTEEDESLYAVQCKPCHQAKTNKERGK